MNEKIINYVALPQAVANSHWHKPFDELVALVGEDGICDAEVRDKEIWQQENDERRARGEAEWGLDFGMPNGTFRRMRGYAIMRRSRSKEIDRENVALLWFQGF